MQSASTELLMLTRRSRAREVALQLLYQHDVNPRTRMDRSAVERFVHDRLQNLAVEPFSLGLYDGVLANATEIDKQIGAAAANWRLPRMAAVDRNVLRIGVFELVFTPETPAGVVIDEAVVLARRFGAKDSSGFVNGVLDRIRQSNVAPAAS